MSSSANSETVRRPTFFEGQIVAAADLNGVVESARVTMAQHERYLHTWGIAEGLSLTSTERETDLGDAFLEVMLQPGLAIDGHGRHLTVTENLRVSEDKFDQLNVASSKAGEMHPVFLIGRDEAPPQSEAPLTACYSTAPTRVVEQVEVTFGRVQDAADPGNEPVTDVAASPGATSQERPWRVLLGFVEWDSTLKRFTRLADSYDGIDRIFAGVRADEVTARGGKLTLRSAAKGENGTPAVELDSNDGGELRFGLQDSSGKVKTVLSVNSKGDLHTEGKITGAISGAAQVQMGSSFDGALVALPPGITQQQMDDGEVTIQVHVTPRYGIPALPSLPAGEHWLMTPIECRSEGRRVFCRVRWTSTAAVVPAFYDLPGICDFTLMAFVASQ